MLLAGLAAGQLAYNRQLGMAMRLFLALVLAAVLAYAFVFERQSASIWVGVAATIGVLLWLRYRHMRVPVAIIAVALIATNQLLPSLYQFGGGEAEWLESGGPRLVLIERVLEVTMRNPVTGLGPAAYRPYANATPLPYQRAYWLDPQVSSHNNYVDLFAHGGLIGLFLFVWFAAALGRLALRLRTRHTEGFEGGYVNGMLAVGVGGLVIMMLADWILPFVYNVGFAGFQASALVWLFLGGLVALDNMPEGGMERRGS
jgi:hypothetical protein